MTISPKTDKRGWQSYAIGLALLAMLPTVQADTIATPKHQAGPHIATSPLSIAWSHWPPFSQRDDKGQLTGLDITLTSKILKQAGFPLTFREIPWARALHLVEHDQLDVAMAALPLPERQSYARFSAPYRQSAYVLLSNDPIPGQQDRWGKLTTLPNLCNEKGLKLGKLRGTRPMEQMENCPALKKATEYNADDHLIDLLLARRLDGIIMEWQYARYRLTQLGAAQFISCQLLLHNQPVSLMFAKNSINDEQLGKINEAIRALPKANRQFSPPLCRLNADPGAADLLSRHVTRQKTR